MVRLWSQMGWTSARARFWRRSPSARLWKKAQLHLPNRRWRTFRRRRGHRAWIRAGARTDALRQWFFRDSGRRSPWSGALPILYIRCARAKAATVIASLTPICPFTLPKSTSVPKSTGSGSNISSKTCDRGGRKVVWTETSRNPRQAISRQPRSDGTGAPRPGGYPPPP